MPTPSARVAAMPTAAAAARSAALLLSSSARPIPPFLRCRARRLSTKDRTPDAAPQRTSDPGSSVSTTTDAAQSAAPTGVCSCPPSCSRCSYVDLDARHALHPYSSMTCPQPAYPVASASGPHLHLEDGRTVLDGMSSWWAAVHGYSHPAIDAAVRDQLDKMSHVMFGGLTHRPASELCGRLVELTPHPLTKVFLCDSGSVSVEVAMKMAVQYWHATTGGAPRKSKFVSLTNGYHGDTFGAMSVCDPVNGMHSMFGGILAEQIFVESPDGPTPEDAERCAAELDRTLSQVGDEVAAVIMEPVVQGAGGMRFYHPKLLSRVREACDRHGVLMILDEIATGFGRTGTLFASEQDGASFRPWYSTLPGNVLPEEEGGTTDGAAAAAADPPRPPPCVVPDILCLGKALTGGYMTMGATMTTDRVAEGISGRGGVFMHGPTFMGNPLASATALASLDVLTSGQWRDRVKLVESALVESMAPAADLDSVREVRVLGAIGVCELKEPISDVPAIQRTLVAEGVWLRPFGKLLYTMPPFNCPELLEGHVERIGRAICKAVAQC